MVAPKAKDNSQERSSQKKTSQKKIEANRRNAQRSTGPKTERGKRAVARNAFKYGLLAGEVVITHGDGAENLEEFVELLRRLCEDYQPLGAIEELLVERIATCWWRLARVLRVEMGQINKRLDNVGVSYPLEQLKQPNLDLLLLAMSEHGFLYKDDKDGPVPTMQERLADAQRLQTNLRTDSVGIKYLQSVLYTVKREIESKGFVSEQGKKLLMCAIGYCDYFLIEACLSLNPPKHDVQENGTADPSDPNRERDARARREQVMALLDQRAQYLQWRGERAEMNQVLDLRAEAKSRALPNETATGTLLRYETHLDRLLYRAMDELERLQRRRKGENVPPPLNVNLGRRS